MVSSAFTIIDATNLVAGRLASIVAKKLLNGEKVAVVNAEKAVFSGKKPTKVEEMKLFLEIVGRGNPKYGPRHPRRPDTILKRMVRGMLPREKPKGIQALKNLRVYVGVPMEAGGNQFQTFQEASADKLKCSYVSIGEIAKEVGWKGVA